MTSYCPSQSAAKLTRPLDWPKFENQLHSLISCMHTAGVAHCDLRGPGNILIDDTDGPWLVDYVACVFQAPSWNKPWNYLFSQACKADFSAILKLKQKIAPQQLTFDETRLLEKNASRGWLFRKTSLLCMHFQLVPTADEAGRHKIPAKLCIPTEKAPTEI